MTLCNVRMRGDPDQHLMDKWMIGNAAHVKVEKDWAKENRCFLTSFHWPFLTGARACMLNPCAAVIAKGRFPASVELTLIELPLIRSSQVYWNPSFKYSSLRTRTHAEAIVPHCSLEVMVTVHLALFRKLGHEDFFQLPHEFAYWYCHLLYFLCCILYFSYPRQWHGIRAGWWGGGGVQKDLHSWLSTWPGAWRGNNSCFEETRSSLTIIAHALLSRYLGNEPQVMIWESTKTEFIVNFKKWCQGCGWDG